MSVATSQRIAYIVSRFPKISETFILSEIDELEKLGLPIELFSIVRERETVLHPQAQARLPRVHFASLWTARTLASNLDWLRRTPLRYLAAWWLALWGNRRSLSFLLRSVVIVPLAAHFAREMERLGVTQVHGAWATHPALAAYVVHALTGLPYSFTIHSHELYINRTMLDEKIRRARFYTTISNYNRKMIARLYGDAALAHLRIIHCGIRPNVFRPIARVRADEPFTIVCVASLEQHKGHVHLLEACAQLKQNGVNFRCRLVGDGPDRNALESLADRLDIAAQVEFLGRQPTNRVVEILQHADVVTLQSVMLPNGMSEGIPVSLMEAMSTGVPVVASRLRGIPELVEDRKTGLLIPPADSPALAQALLTICRDQQFALHLARAGREKVLREFDLAHSAAQFYELFTGEEPTRAQGLSA